MNTNFAKLLTIIGKPLLKKATKSGSNWEASLDVLIILGTNINKNESPSFGLLKRVQKGASLARELSINNIILSGGRKIGNKTEAQAMLDVLNKILTTNHQFEIILEQVSQNTLENAKCSIAIMKSRGFTKGLVITSPYHVSRVSTEYAYFHANVSVLPAFRPEDYPVKSHIRALIHEYPASFLSVFRVKICRPHR